MADIIVLTSDSRKDKWKRRLVVARYVFPRVMNILILVCAVAIMIVGAKVINGDMPAPEFTYEQFIGIVLIMVGVIMLRIKVR